MRLSLLRLAFSKVIRKPELLILLIRPEELFRKLRLAYSSLNVAKKVTGHFGLYERLARSCFYIRALILLSLEKKRREGLFAVLATYSNFIRGRKDLHPTLENIRLQYDAMSKEKFEVHDFQKINLEDHRAFATDRMATFGKLSAKTSVTVITPVCNPDPVMLEALCSSLNCQTLDRCWFEVIFVDDSSDTPVDTQITGYMRDDITYKVIRLKNNSGISKTQNQGIGKARNEVIVFVDHDDFLPPTSLAWVSTYASQYPDAKIFYTDENIIDVRNREISSWNKSKFNRIQSLFHNSLHHLFGVRRSVFDVVGKFNPDFDFCQDFDFNSRCLFAFDDTEFCYIPHVCYSWRQHSKSTALVGTQKPIIRDRLYALVQKNSSAIGLDADFIQPARTVRNGWSLLQPVWNKTITPNMMCSIIIPTRNNTTEFTACLNSILRSTDPTIREIIIIDDHSDGPTVQWLYSQIVDGNYLNNKDSDSTTIRLVSDIRAREDFNFSRLINFGVSLAQFDTIVLCNNDVLVPQDDWAANLSYLLNKCSIGVVGALLLNGNKIEHSGVVIGANNGLAANQNAGRDASHIQSSIELNTIREVSAVTGALMAFSKDLHSTLNGFDEDKLAVEFNDVDFCLRARKIGCRVVVNPHVTASHATSTSRKQRVPNIQEHISYLENHFSIRDPFNHPRFVFDGIGVPTKGALVSENFFSNFITANIFVHELSLTGAPIFLLELIRGVKRWGFEICVYALCDGPLRNQFEEVADFLFVSNSNVTPYISGSHAYTDFLDQAGIFNHTNTRRRSIFVFNTIVVLPIAAIISKRLGDDFPSVLYVHEDLDLLDHIKLFFDPKVRELVLEYLDEGVFAALFQSAATSSKYAKVLKKAKLMRIRGSVSLKETSDEDNSSMRQKLRLPQSCYVVSVIGTISARKNQLTLAREIAAETTNISDDVVFIFYGANHSDYCQELRHFVDSAGLSNVYIVDEDPYPERIFGITDLLVSASTNESYPRVVLEAAGRGIPVVAADCSGVREIINHGYNGTLVDYHGGFGLIDAMNKVIVDNAHTSNMALIGRRDFLRFNNSSALETYHASLWVQVANVR